MKVVILAGGYGTRMSELTANMPKPLVEVAGKPLIWYIMNIYAAHGYNDFIVAAGYKAEKIKEYFANIATLSNDFQTELASGKTTILKERKPDWRVAVVDTGLDTMTGGRVRRLAEYIDGEDFMLTYGDGVADIDIKELVKFHKAHGKLATITAVRMPRFGMVNVEDGGKVSSFQEKRLDNSPLINGGFMVFSKKVIDYIEGDDTALEAVPMQRLCAAGELYAYKHNGFWSPVDTLRDRTELETILLDKNGKVKLWPT